MDQKSIIFSAILVAALLQGCGGGTKPAVNLSNGKETGKASESLFSLKPYLQEAAIKSSSNQDYVEAATYWYALFQENPDDLNTALQCAYNMRYANNPGDAVNVLTRALKAHPGNIQLLAERGKAYAALGNAELALGDITLASQASAADWSVHSAHGVILDRLGRHNEAEAAYNRALSISPGNPIILNNLALNLALAGRHEEAVSTLQRATQSPNANIQIRQNLSLLLAMQGDIKQAGQLAQADLPNAMAQNNMMYFEGLSENTP
ncbi:MAG: tetratricopeptide repeat protein [Alphaproteobacteria bacterium]|nr:tetratricopeptide repeat protein [Alphaproteobacteria bacterium]